MSYASLIDRNLNLAFQKLKDLAIVVTLTKKSGATFDFASGAVANETSSTVVTKAIWLDEEKKEQPKRQIMLKRKDIGDISIYDTISDGTVWKISAPIKNDGYIAILEVHKGA